MRTREQAMNTTEHFKCVPRCTPLGIALALCFAINPLPALAQHWTQRGGDAGHSGYVNVTLDPVHFQSAWSVAMNYPQSGTGSWAERAVSSDGQRVYRTELEGYAPSGKYHVFALDLYTGAQQWVTTLQGRAFSGVGEPSVMNGLVYVNRAGHSGISGGTLADYPKLYGLDAETGQVVFATNYSAQWGNNDRPTVDDQLIVAAGGYYGGAYAYNAASGAVQWTSTASDFATPGAAFDSQNVYAFGPAVYSRVYGTQVGEVIDPNGGSLTRPVLGNEGQLLYSYSRSGSDQGVAAFDAATRAHLWDFNAAAGVSSTALGGGKVAAIAGGTLFVVNAATGNELFHWRPSSNLSSELVLTRSHAFVCDGSRTYAVDLSGGTATWSHPISGELALSDNYLLVSNTAGVSAFAVPEPSTLALLAIGVLGLLAWGWRRKSFGRTACCVAVALLSAGGSPRQACAAPIMYRLTDLGACTATNDAAQCITESGMVGLQQGVRAYVWQNGTRTPLEGLPNGNTQMRVNLLGHIAGADGLRAYLWRDGVTTPLGTLENNYTFSAGINDLDQIVGTSYRGSMNRYRGFLWQNGSMIDIGGFLPTGETRPTDINNVGQIVGSSDTASHEQPFVYQNGTMTQLSIPAGYVRGTASAISANGNIAGTCRKDNFSYSQATAWIGGQRYALGTMNQSASWATDINDAGQVVGSVGPNDSSPTTAFLWQSGVMQDVNSLVQDGAGYVVNRAYGINNAGQIVGTARYGSQTRAVLLTPVPEPSTLTLLALGSLGLLAYGWRLSSRLNGRRGRSTDRNPAA